ncbi:hypothetical protein OPV22_018970 [Ensete ventricosum]|uniref:HTH myb-type domain-containing protein n=1 Tax=Ensete ventricosum TaxID=4639 RepID=A0AAV8QX36_ENSVE|nr:hypothetical protein OPV22_018970 [Ensete ventricosum]
MEDAGRFQELIDALDEERRKVEVFHRELPLCLHLINQTIESYRQQLMVRDLTLSHEVAEKEWISLRPSSMSSQVSGSKQQQHPWPRKATKSWGESQSSDKEEDAAAPITGPAGGEGDHNGGTDREKKEKFRHRRRKMRRYWTDELHERFLHAVEQLGGCHAATPKQIRKVMKVDELTSDEIKSHLQVVLMYLLGEGSFAALQKGHHLVFWRVNDMHQDWKRSSPSADKYPKGLQVEVKDSYPSVMEDLQALKAVGQIWLLSNMDSQEDIVYPNDPKVMIKVDDDIKQHFREIKLSRDTVDVEKELEKNDMKPATNMAKRRVTAQFHGITSLPKPKKKREITKRTKLTNAHLPELFQN